MQAHINKSLALKNELQALKNESQALRNELQAHRNKSLALKNELQALRNKSKALKNESQETFNNESQQTNESPKINESPQTNESQQTNESRAFKKNKHKKMINTIKMIIKEFACKDFNIIIKSKDKIMLELKQTFLKAIKNVYTKKTIKITIGRDVIMLKSQQLSNVCNARICTKEKKVLIIRGNEIIRENEIILKTEKIFQNEDKEINVEEINKITLYDHKFIYESRRHENDQHGLNTEEVYASKVCKNERFILLNIIMMILYKYVKKYAKKNS